MAYQKLTPILSLGATSPRYVEDHFADVLSVKDFGAAGDGTTDDSAALAAAFASGGKIVFEKGKTYKIASTIYAASGGLDLDMNGSRLLASSGVLLVLAPQNTAVTGYGGLADIAIRNGTFEGCALGMAHNSGVVIDSVSFINTESEHHIQIFASHNVHIRDCRFSGIKTSSSQNPHYESINIDPGDYTAFPFFDPSSATYDATKNSNIIIESCLFDGGSGIYQNLDCCIGTHYNDIETLHDCICIDNCIMTGVTKWAVRANSWKNSKVSNCYIETEQFAFDVGYQQRAENITFSDCMIVQDFAEHSVPPIHYGPYRCGNLNISNVKYKDSSGTVSMLPDYTQSAGAAAGASAATYSPSVFADIVPLRSGTGFSLGKEDSAWGGVFSNEVTIKKANPYLDFVETDVEKGEAPEGTGYQGVVFRDKNGTPFARLVFQTQGVSSPYNTLSLVHYGNSDYEDEHSVFLRQDSSDSTWHFAPSPTDTVSLGKPSYLWKNIYAATGSITTSDERSKSGIAAVPDNVMRAWSRVEFKAFQYRDAVSEKKGEARIHVGVVAQDIQRAFEAEGLDASRFGLFCRDEWEEGGAKADSCGVRYVEALALECACLRVKTASMQKEIDRLAALFEVGRQEG